MSRALLGELLEYRAFDPTLPFQALGELHAPFDSMNGGTQTETRLAGAVNRGERIALVGTSGNGKSSTAAFIAQPGNESIVGFRIGVTVEDPSILGSPGRFAQHIVRRIAREALELPAPERLQLQMDVADSQELRPSRSRRGGAKVSAKVIEVSGELGVVSDSITQQTSSLEMIEALDHALDLIRGTDAQPLLVIDDSDTWIEDAAADVATKRSQFFGPTLRMLAERGCGLMVAVDERYLEVREYEIAREGILSMEVMIPRIDNPNGLGLLLQQRVEQISEANVVDALTEQAIGDLFESYTTQGLSLRTLMRCVSGALYLASESDADLIGHEATGASLRQVISERGS